MGRGLGLEVVAWTFHPDRKLAESLGQDPAALVPACLEVVRRLVERMYPPGRSLSGAQRQAAAEQSLLAVYLHSHMDEDTLDLARLAVCPDQVPDPEGRLIPACAYNLFYRQKDPRFWRADS